MNHKNKSQGTDEKIVRQLAPANENLTANVLKVARYSFQNITR